MHLTYAEIFRPAEKTRALAYDVFLILAGTVMLALSAQLAIYITPAVPLTGQTFAVLLLGALYGSRRGAFTVLAYLAQGAVGLPVFANGQAGVAYMMGPTGGYLVGFAVAAFVVGWLAERGWDRKLTLTFVAMVIGNLVIYLHGIAWFSIVLDFKQAMALAVLPFIPGDLIKIALATVLLPGGWAVMAHFDRS